MTEGPLPRYRELRRGGQLRPDPGQELAAEKLQSIYNALRHYTPSNSSAGWKERLGLARRRGEIGGTVGIKMHGGGGITHGLNRFRRRA